MTESRKARRKAAWLCFESYLDVEQRLLAIQLLEQSYQVDGMMNQINYIGAVCSRFGISDGLRKPLNHEFYRLLSEMPDSAMDPLTMLQQSRQTTVKVKSSPPQETAEEKKSSPNDQSVAKKSAKQPAHMLVFCQLVYQVFNHCDHVDLFATLRQLVDEGPERQREFSGMIEQWSEKPDNFSWALKLVESDLKRFVHLLYTGVCDALGPVEADRCFHRALAACEKRPEAREYPPSKYL